MTEVQITARAQWTGADFAITVDQIASDDEAYLSDRDIGARVIESLRARGYHVVDNRAEYHEALSTMAAEPEDHPQTFGDPKLLVEPAARVDIRHLTPKPTTLDFGLPRMNIFRWIAGLFAAIFGRRDAEAYVERRAEASGEDLDPHHSVVDLLKSLGRDSSFEARKALAYRWGRQLYSGTAEENVWLHQEIMRKVKSGGW